MAREIKVDFYQVELAFTPDPFEAILDRIELVPLKDRCFQVQGAFIRLNSLIRHGSLREGDFTKIRMDEIPDKASLKGPDCPLGLEQDEGLSHCRAFLYDPSLKVLAIQRRRSGPSGTDIETYVKHKGGLAVPITLNPILHLDAYMRLMKIHTVKKFHLKVAGISNPGFYKNLNLDTPGLLALADDFQAPTAEITLSMGRAKGSLNQSKIKKIAQRLTTLGKDYPDNVTKLELAGVDEDGNSSDIDLLVDPMVEKVNVGQSAGRRTTQYDERRAAVAEAFRRRKSELKEILGKPGHASS